MTDNLVPGWSPAAEGYPALETTEVSPGVHRLVVEASATLPALGTGTDRSGTITTGGTAQDLAAANAARASLTGQNLSSGDLWINETGGTAAASAAGSFKVAPGASFSVSTNQKVSIVGATTSQAFAATET